MHIDKDKSQKIKLILHSQVIVLFIYTNRNHLTKSSMTI